MARHAPIRLALILLGATLACATATRSTKHASSDRNVIEAAELDSTTATTLLDVVRQLRPDWLQRATSGVRSIRRSAGASSDQLNVYVDDVRYTGTAMLAQLNPNGVSRLKYFSASEAQMRFGEGNTAGVIQVVTRAGRR